MWSDWAEIMAETLREVIETNSHPQALKHAVHNLSVYDKQCKAVADFRKVDNLGGYPERCVHSRSLTDACTSCN